MRNIYSALSHRTLSFLYRDEQERINDMKVLFGGDNRISLPNDTRMIGTFIEGMDELIPNANGNLQYVRFKYEGQQSLKFYTLKHLYADDVKIVTVTPNVYWMTEGTEKTDIQIGDVVRFNTYDKGWKVTDITDTVEDAYSIEFANGSRSIIVEGFELLIKNEV